jgi:hypothetical protein
VAERPGYRIKQHLPHRVRIHFVDRLLPEQLRSVIWLLEHHHPGAVVRQASSGQGLVICSRDPAQPLLDPLARLEQALSAAPAHLPEPPPTALQRLLRQSHQGTLKLLISLAIAGWALPVLPGTPFFLLAWWLGWRPETARDQRKSSSTQGAATRAAQQSS